MFLLSDILLLCFFFNVRVEYIDYLSICPIIGLSLAIGKIIIQKYIQILL